MQRRYQFAMYTYETKAFLHRMLMLDTRICGHISCRVILKQRTRLNRIDKGYVTPVQYQYVNSLNVVC